MDLYPEANIQKIYKNSLNHYNFIAKRSRLFHLKKLGNFKMYDK